MQRGSMRITNERGLHARAAARFVHVASGFSSSIRVMHDEAEADGKSILSLMILGAARGKTLDISADGPDEAEALQALLALVDCAFDEG